MKKIVLRMLRWFWLLFKWTAISVIFLAVALSVAVNLQPVQQLIIDKAATEFGKTTGGKLEIEGFDLRIPYKLTLTGLNLSGPEGAHIVYLEHFEIRLAWRMLFDKTALVESFSVRGLDADIYSDTSGEWNYDFILHAFAPEEDAEPDPASEASDWDVRLKKFRLSDVSLRYYDAESLDSIAVTVGELNIRMRRFSLSGNVYYTEFVQFRDSESFVRLGPRPGAEDVDSEGDSGSGSLPDVFLNHALLENHKATFIDMSDGSTYTARLEHFEVHPEVIDLAEDRYAVSEIALQGLDLDMLFPESPPSDAPFDGDIFVPLHLAASEIDLKDINLVIKSFSALTEPDTLIALSALRLAVRDLETGPEIYRIGLAEAGLRYPGLPRLNSLSFGAEITPQGAKINDLRAAPGTSALRAELAVAYTDLASAVNDLQFHGLSLNLTELRLETADLTDFIRFADSEADLPPLPASSVRARASVSGSHTALNFKNVRLATGESSVRISGSSAGSDLERHAVLISDLNLDIFAGDLDPWLPDSLDRDLLPGRIGFSGKGKAAPQFSSLEGLLSLPYGDITLSAVTGGWASEVYDLSADVRSDYLDLRDFAESDTFYTRFDLSARLADLTGENLRGDLRLDIPEFGFGDIRLHNIEIADTLDGDLHKFGLALSDTMAVFRLSGTATLGENVEAQIKGDLAGADLQYIGLTEKDIRVQTVFTAEYMGNDSIQRGKLDLGDVTVIREGERIDLSPSILHLYLGPDSTGVTVQSDLFRIYSASNLSLDMLYAAMLDLYKDEPDPSAKEDGYWIFDFESKESDLIRDIFLPGLDRLEPASAKVRYTAADHTANAVLTFPRTDIYGARIDSLAMKVNAAQGEIFGSFGIQRVAYDSLAVNRIELTAGPDSGATRFVLTVGDEPASAPYRIGALLSYVAEDSLRGAHTVLKPDDSFVLNGMRSQVDPEACFRFGASGTQIYNFALTKGDGRFSMSKETGAETLEIDAENFDLAFLSGMLDLEEDLISGLLSTVVRINSDGTFEGEGDITGFKAAGADLGTFSFSGEAVKSYYRISADMNGPMLDFAAGGRIIPQEAGSSVLDVKTEITKFDAAKIAEIVPAFVQSAGGTATGRLDVGGTTAAPSLTGNLNFSDVSIRLKGSNGVYKLADESLRIEPNALIFPKFNITDSSGEKLRIDGRINHSNFSTFAYDLSVKSDRFTLVDLEERKDAEFYGKLIVGADIRITGSDDAPRVRSDISLKRGSSVVFKVPESEYRQFDDDGLVEWVVFDAAVEDEIMRRDKTDALPPAVQRAIDLAGTLNIDRETKMRIIIDPVAGDYIEIEGGGKLSVSYDKAGRINLSGTYAVTSGAYLMTFYNVVKRKFLIEEGSRITWNGDPMSADLAMTAIYPTRASAVGLMTGANANAASDAMRRMLDWEVLMNIKGELEAPDIGFDLRLARSSRGNSAIESRLAQLRDTESELNKQVFGLMLFNSFIPEGGGTGGGNMVGNQARSSASQLLTQQLNNLSDKLVGGVELTFDLQSYESSGMSETDLSVDLSKTMFNDRVVVSVGSTVALEQNDPAAAQNAGQLMTNFVVEYKLTEDGRYRLKAFRSTDIEDILVGLITRTGAGFVFRRTFDRKDEIFKKTEEEVAAEKESDGNQTEGEAPENRIKNGEETKGMNGDE